MAAFPVAEALRRGWETFKQRPGFFVLATIGTIVVGSLLSAVVDYAAAPNDWLTSILGGIVNFAVQCFIGLAWCRVTLRAVDALEAVSLEDAWAPQYVLSFAAASILSTILIVLGFILLIVPGVILAIMLMFAMYPIAEQGLGPIKAMALSRTITSGNRWRLFLFVVLLVLINLLGAIALVVGLLVSIPVSALATAHAYRWLVWNAGQMQRAG
jgi:uncharacterized membrane protein